MALQVGTVDGLINIGPKITDVFVKAIAAFAEQGVEYAKSKGIPFGTAFQRFTYPVYSGETAEFDVTSIDTPVYTKSGKEQSPAFITYCRKMGLLIIDESKSLFGLTLIGEALLDERISLQDYALVILSKQGVYQNGIYKVPLFTHIVEMLNSYPSITVETLQQHISTLYHDNDITKTRFDILLGAFATSGLLVKDNNAYYIGGLKQAKVFEDIAKHCEKISPALLDDDDDYTLYIGEGMWGIFDILLPSNIYVYQELFPKLTELAKLCGTYLQHKYPSANSPLQKIFYGAPGTGKSHQVKKQTGEWISDDEEQDLPNVFRTTFHPDTDYATFVGCYKPTMKPTTNAARTLSGKEEEIVYEYVPQVFTDAYVHAYNNPDEPTYLVIEEINRGNCAQIFGDLFQLLDRKKGKSEYKIKADKDLAKYLCEAKDQDGQDVLKDKEGIKDRKLCLPANLHILATMNTSDQSLFPMDSAFKRRWDWEYIPIKYSNSDWIIDIAGYKYSWIDFQTEINKRIFGATESEDKQLGDFFVKANDNNIISSKLLLNKVIFYLWNDVCKDGDGDIFKVNTDLDYSKELDPAKNEDITFSKFFKETDLKLKQWMRYLNIKPLNSQEDDDEEKEDEAHQQEEGVKPNEAKPDTYSKPEYKSIVENMLPQLSNEDISIFRNGFDWSFSEMPGSYARMSLALDAPAKNKKATVKLWIPAPTGYSKSAECFAYLKDRGGEDIIRTTASKYGYEYEELGIHSKNPNPVVGWKITIPMTFAPENSQAESQKLLDILSEVRTAFNPIISDFLKK